MDKEKCLELMNNLSDDELFNLYNSVCEHLSYLEDSIIVEEEKVEENG
jgi:hypothetical protein